jgi:four helix bundle protein
MGTDLILIRSVLDIAYTFFSRGSTNETIDWYEKLKRLGYVSLEVFKAREATCLELRAMLSKIIDSLEKRK